MMEYQNGRSDERIVLARSQVLVILAALVVTAIGSFAIGYVAATVNSTGNVPAMKVFWEAWRLADSEFYYTKPSETDRVYGAINGMLASFQDQFTAFVAPVPAAANTQLIQGEVGGIGVRIGVDKDGQLVVNEAMIGKAAALAGVQSGDVIIGVDGKPLKGLSFADAVSLIRGPIGTQVALQIQRPGVAAPITVTVTRQQINIYGKMLPDGIAYISMGIFSKTAPAELERELRTLLKDNPRALILDLRGNPGGLLDESLKIADLFLPDGPIASEKLSSGENIKFSAHSGDIGESIPMVVLVDKGSASASEIVSGALQDRHRAVLIGQQTFGKGSVQQLFTLSDGSQLRITHGAWYTPNETPIQRNGEHIGLTPDVAVTVPDTPAANSDPILDAATDYVKVHYMDYPVF
jgi:carboxyl-terminal processing protease